MEERSPGVFISEGPKPKEPSPEEKEKILAEAEVKPAVEPKPEPPKVEVKPEVKPEVTAQKQLEDEAKRHKEMLDKLNEEELKKEVKVLGAEPPEAKELDKRAMNFGFVGIGQGGSRIADAFYQLGYPACVINTTSQDFVNISVPDKLLLDYKIGAHGKDIEVGRRAAIANRPAIYNLFKNVFSRDVDTLFITIGGGGKTGTGGAPIAREEAEAFVKDELKADIPIGMVYTLPRKREPATVKENAAKILDEIKGVVTPLILIDNQIISERYPAPVTKFWTNANDKIASIFHQFNVRAAFSGRLDNFDISEFRSVIESGGCLVFGKSNMKSIGKASDIAEAFEQNLTNGMLYRFTPEQLLTAKKGGACLVASEASLDTVMEDELAYGFTVLTNTIGGSDVFSGVYIDNDVEGFDFYTILGGIEI